MANRSFFIGISTAIALSGTAMAETRISVPTDAKASYFILSKAKLANGNLQVVSRRVGPSGTSYSRREINCQRMTFRYTGEGDTLRELDQPYNKGAMGPLTEGSISTYISMAACRGR